MDPQHRDRVAFVRICSGKYDKGMKARHVRLGKDVRLADALTFMASERGHVDEAFSGDIIGLHNHGTIRIGDTFTAGEDLVFTGIPNFAPELFRRAALKDPLKMKALQKGLDQLCEEGATQLFRPLINNDLILGAVGVLQFEVVAQRLADEYKVECRFEPVATSQARWIRCADERKLARLPPQAREQPLDRSRRRARLPRPDAGEPVDGRGALARGRVPGHARAGVQLSDGGAGRHPPCVGGGGM